MRGMIFVQFLDWYFLGYRQQTAMQLRALNLDLKEYRSPLTVAVFRLLPYYIEYRFREILVFLAPWVSKPDTLDEEESCTIGSTCCKKSRYMSFRLFGAAMYLFDDLVEKPTLVEFALKLLELDPKLYKKMIRDEELLPLSFKRFACEVTLPTFNEHFSFVNAPFADTPYVKKTSGMIGRTGSSPSFLEYYKIKDNMTN